MIFTLIFHAVLFHSQWFPMRSVQGEWPLVTGPAPTALLIRLRYDETGRYWEIEEGGEHAWTWVPLREGDRVTLEDGVVRIEGI